MSVRTLSWSRRGGGPSSAKADTRTGTLDYQVVFIRSPVTFLQVPWILFSLKFGFSQFSRRLGGRTVKHSAGLPG